VLLFPARYLPLDITLFDSLQLALGLLADVRLSRGIERLGSGSMVEQAFTGFVALEAPKNPHEVLGVRPGASEEEIDAAHRRKAIAARPDKGGSAGDGGIDGGSQEAKRKGCLA